MLKIKFMNRQTIAILIPDKKNFSIRNGEKIYAINIILYRTERKTLLQWLRETTNCENLKEEFFFHDFSYS